MRKIIGFKLALSPRDIQRRAKKAQVALDALAMGEAELQKLSGEAAKMLRPGLLFDTFAHPDPEQSLLSPIPGLAYSLALITLGEGWLEVAADLGAQTPSLACLMPLIRDSALDESLRFASSLIEEEAKKDSCELSPISKLSEPAALEAALRKLEGAKIGLSLADGALSPQPALACALSWVAKAKSRSKGSGKSR
ncbi:MAG: hypothetical protein HY921_00915 [Elusimicrobia bacterium]|nr:hypothetical protein [Elusimicrobiota bacterium]